MPSWITAKLEVWPCVPNVIIHAGLMVNAAIACLCCGQHDYNCVMPLLYAAAGGGFSSSGYERFIFCVLIN